ncbi:type II secretion system GspH family protein [Patescibacteria group bacterium]|nr:type II secretion system GspH family protein [Patescibacteria group bacterium]MBU2036269.1 type II secretion system GspH family protein [Patescibacteria group bacterium]
MKKGFTLIELLVVISIIGVLAALALVSFGPSQKQARDTQRKSDLKQYQTALENFANQHNSLYPSKTSTISPSSMCSSFDISGTCPDDPKEPNYSYSYISNGSGGSANDATDYLLWFESESADGYWVICSSGMVGAVTSVPTSVNCPI